MQEIFKFIKIKKKQPKIKGLGTTNARIKVSNSAISLSEQIKNR